MFCLCPKSSQSIVCQVLEWACELTYYFAPLATMWRNLWIEKFRGAAGLTSYSWNCVFSCITWLSLLCISFCTQKDNRIFILFYLNIFAFIRGIYSALRLQFQKTTNTSQENWNRKLDWIWLQIAWKKYSQVFESPKYHLQKYCHSDAVRSIAVKLRVSSWHVGVEGFSFQICLLNISHCLFG